jgi:hypothetical protein
MRTYYHSFLSESTRCVIEHSTIYGGGEGHTGRIYAVEVGFAQEGEVPHS